MSVSAAGPRFDQRWVQALAHPVRVRMLQYLVTHQLASPVELASTLGIPLAGASYHVRRLRGLGFVTLAKRTPRRGTLEHHYRLTDPAETAASLWRVNAEPPEPELPEPFDSARDADAWASLQEAVRGLRRRREQHRLTQAELAARAGLTAAYLGRIERGEADPPLSVLLRLAAELDTTPDELFRAPGRMSA